MGTLIQCLDLEVGERAVCYAAYPKKSKCVVECILDFDKALGKDEIIENPKKYVKVIEYGLIGLSTSHLASGNWEKL